MYVRVCVLGTIQELADETSLETRKRLAWERNWQGVRGLSWEHGGMGVVSEYCYWAPTTAVAPVNLTQTPNSPCVPSLVLSERTPP